ncbi:MAG: dihydroorotase [Actinomycetota bacterium]
MASLAVKGGTLVDATGERRADVVIDDGRITAVGPDLSGDIILDASGCFVSPGLVDLNARLGQPGNEEAETIESASRAAALGGFTAVVAMPDTDPVVDGPAGVREIHDLSRDALCDIEIAGTVTVGGAGERLSPMSEMADLGVALFTDAGTGVQDDRLMRRALEYASGLGLTIAQHCDNEALSRGGHMHEGVMSSDLGIPGVPAEAEELMVVRDITLSRLTGGRVHFQHLSTAGSLGMVRAARTSGLPITAEVAPHHLVLTDEAIASYDPVFKTSPPLRTPNDVAALRQALADGIIDAIVSDHTPHEPHLKELPFDEAPSGGVGLETALAVALTELDLPVPRILAALSWGPAAVAGLSETHGGPIDAGRPANLTVIDPTAEWVVDPTSMASRSRSTLWAGRSLRGRVRHTVLHGEPVVVDAEARR